MKVIFKAKLFWSLIFVFWAVTYLGNEIPRCSLQGKGGIAGTHMPSHHSLDKTMENLSQDDRVPPQCPSEVRNINYLTANAASISIYVRVIGTPTYMTMNSWTKENFLLILFNLQLQARQPRLVTSPQDDVPYRAFLSARKGKVS